MLLRFHRIGWADSYQALWDDWERWFAEVDETHTSYPPLVFFRSPQPDRSWITAGGAVLDTAALVNAAIDLPHDPSADICLRAGYIALRHVAAFFGIVFDPDPAPNDPVSITRAEFEEALDSLAAGGVPCTPIERPHGPRSPDGGSTTTRCSCPWPSSQWLPMPLGPRTAPLRVSVGRSSVAGVRGTARSRVTDRLEIRPEGGGGHTEVSPPSGR